MAIERVAEPVPGPGWLVVGRTKGPLPELHRADPKARTHSGTIATVCGVLVRHIAEVPEGTPAHLCKDCK